MIKCKIISDFDFIINHKVLDFIYQPIVGKQAINIYKNLYSLQEFNKQLGANISLTDQDVCNHLNTNFDELLETIKLLEAMNLVSTYKDVHKNNLIVWKLNQTLNWYEFNKNHKYHQLLKMRLDSMEYERLKIIFQETNQYGLVNCSCSFDDVFGIKFQKFELDFDLFYEFLNKNSDSLISLTDENKVILNNAYEKYLLNYNQLQDIVLSSIIKQDKKIIVDDKLLTLNIKKVIDTRNVNQLNLNLKINRNKQIFLSKCDLEEFKYVIDDYKTLNSEHYLACIQKHELSNFDINFIKSLRNDCYLEDYVINILIDFCLFINNGRIEPLYIKKIALTLNRLNLVEIKDILLHLQKATNKKYKYNNKHKISDDKVDW